MRNRDRAGRIAVGLMSLAVLAILIAGLPAALYVLGGSPIPRALPAWNQVAATLSRPDDGTLFLASVRWASWLAWALFAVSCLVEGYCRVRRRPVPRLPVIGPPQAIAAALIGTTALGLLPAPHLSRPAAAGVTRRGLSAGARLRSAPPPAVQAPARGAIPADARPGPADRRSSRPRWERYRVVASDNLWDIAASHLGDGGRWREIYALNRGRRQPDGLALSDPNLILPGWILILPPPAAPARHARPPAPARRCPAPASGRHPGPANPTPPRRPQIPRSAPPRHRRPGEHRPVGTPPRRAARPVGISLPGGGLVGITLAAAISAALVAWRLHRRRAFVPRWPIPDERAEPPLPDAIRALRRAHLRSLAADAAEARGEPWPDDPEPGEVIQVPSEVTGDDEGLDEFGAPAGTAWQPVSPVFGDGQHLAAPGTSVAGGTPSGPLPAPLASPGLARPFGTIRGEPDGALPPDEEYEPPAPPARPQAAGTVVFGTRGSAEMPLAAAAAGGLGLTGPGAHGTARALLIGVLAASAPVGGQLARVIIPEALFRQLTGELGLSAAQVPCVSPGLPDGLVTTPGLAAAFDRAETEITRRLRLLDAGEDSLPPLVLIAPADATAAPRIRAILHAGANAGVTGILLGNWPAGITCHIRPGGEVTAIGDLSLAGVLASHLTPADTAAMLSMLRGAQGHLADDQPPRREARPGQDAEGAAAEPQSATQASPGGADAGTGRPAAAGEGDPGDPGQRPAARPPRPRPAQPGPPGAMTAPPDAEPPAAQAETLTGSGAPAASTPVTASTGKPVRISVLGRLRITACGQEISGGLRKARELLAYLAVHPEGVTGESIGEALWPESSPRYAASQRHLAMRKARQMLRTTTGLSAPMFIVLAAERYRLDPSLIEVDLWQFDTALDHARDASGKDQLAALRQAISLYQGPLSDGAAYEWAERHAEPARRRAVDALARAADILRPGDPEQALTTLETALTHDPYNEALYQKIMDIQVRLGRPDAARRTLALLESRLSAIGLTPSAGTLHASSGSALAGGSYDGQM